MHINILHRPELAPAKMEAFKMQQDMVHEMGLSVTLLATAPSLDDEACVELMKSYREEFEDEIGLSFHDLGTEEIINAVGYTEAAFWMYDMEDKRKVASLLVQKFESTFGFLPKSAASYHFDASSLEVLKEVCPSIKTVVGGCFEEGVRVFHGCNHSWYLFNEGMPWGPWYPSKSHALRPAMSEADSAGIVAVPHLSRDMALAYEGRNDFWASHPPNVQRGKGNDGENCPYDKNLIDQHRFQERYNNGFSYLNVFVGPTWLIHNHNSEEAPAVSVSLYRQQLEYIKSLAEKGEAQVQTMDEFGAWYRANVPVAHNEVFLAKEMLYGSGKHYVWHLSPQMRVLVDLSQGGSIGDLRPYQSQIPVVTGRNTEKTFLGSYPFLIQSQHRTGSANHYLDGSRTTAFIELNGETVDLSDIKMRAQEVYTDHRGFISEPVTISFSNGGAITLQVEYLFDGNQVQIRRVIKNISSSTSTAKLTEYIKASYGTTEYPEDMKGVVLAIDGEEKIEYEYRGKKVAQALVKELSADIPQINTKITWKPADDQQWAGEVSDGILFSPYFTLALSRNISANETSKICLEL